VPPDARSGIGRPSAFFRAHLAEIEEAARLGPVLDLACGRGRHALALVERGLRVVALDRNRESLDRLGRAARGLPGTLELVEADLEADAPPRLEAAPFGAVLVFRYLHRPLAPWIAGLLAPGGLLLYETFTRAQRRLGWGPSRDAFLLEPGELPKLFVGLEIGLYEEGPSDEPEPAETARLLARRPGSSQADARKAR
jgi:SAM-dependent methyltransferase